ncbi:hypothetical protein AB4232_05570 [Vibrio sp. 10N.286.46.A8]|uniref:Uncharacterized protein n=1 Tax=Vibrio atlanticus TaxID=693153 RepID=A0A1C3IU67_9VIBR|nr:MULTISPECIES: hypothetical protein [Vibrio]OEF73312.1 hypothetical protein A152_10590 [Vibrio tasmaniensis 1F-187]PML46312.1 hypothetical protein BCT76_14910 [Vibrio tasmaniensis]SBS64976.1 hypothetical protein VAT7223_02445 [Vibrio atlanticus]
MLLNEIVEVIELTDSDYLSEALEEFNLHNVVHSNHLPFLNIVYDNAKPHLLKKLCSIGFKGQIQCEKLISGDYIIFNADTYTPEQASSKFR